MKKLLAIILTLVMAICLVNLNSDITKADEANVPTYTLSDSGWTESADARYLYSSGTAITISNTSTSKVIKRYVNNSYEADIAPGGSYNYTFTNQGFVTLKGKNIYITEQAPVTTYGLQFVDDGTGGGKWQEYDTSGTPGFKDIDDGRMTALGISHNSETNTTTFSNSIVGDGTYNNATIKISKSVNIVLDKDIAITAGDHICIQNSADLLKINSNGNKLVLKNGNRQTIMSATSGMTIENTVLDCENSSTYPAVFCGGDVTLSGDCVIRILNSGSNYALKLSGLFDVGTYDLIIPNGTKEGSQTNATGTVGPVVKGADGTYALDDGVTTNYVKYIKVTNTVPKPTPEPQPKDESCEKVIGPSWHWNESKGICEDYGVVGTSTR